MARQQIINGLPVAPGIALGPAFLLRRHYRAIEPETIRDDRIERELERLDEAIELSRRDLRYHRRKATRSLGEVVARIFDAHLMILDDEPTFDSVREMIRAEKMSAEYTLWRTMETFARSFESQKEDVFRDRAQDVRDVTQRVLAYLRGSPAETVNGLEAPSILVAAELNPSDVLQLDPEMILAVVTDRGGSTSHTAILTQSLGVPSVVGLRTVSEEVNQGDLVAVNGNSGKVVLRPTGAQKSKYETKQKQYLDYMASLSSIKGRKAVTKDGHRVHVHANVELIGEVKRVLDQGGEGIGLYRTEFMALTRGHLPTEEDQNSEYRQVIRGMKGRPVTVRAFDLGGDKAFPGANIGPEPNPFLGWRAIRIALEQPEEMLLPQLRAVLRASAEGTVRLMFPMITHLEELREAKQHLETARRQLREEGTPFDEDMEVGIMVEVPSVALMAERFAPHVDFFSIGTNDLVQFALAVDRNNERVAHLHQPFHPAILRLIRNTVVAGHTAGIHVSLCGEFAGNPLAVPLLVGLGLDELSVSPAQVPSVKNLILSLTREQSEELADRCLEVDTAREARDHALTMMKNTFRDMPIWFGDA